MKKSTILASVLLLATSQAQAWQGDVTVQTPNIQMLLHANEGQDLRMAYFGSKTASLQEVNDAGDNLNFPALPAFGTVDAVHLPALQVQHANGDQNLELQVTGYETTNEANAVVHTITMQDRLMPFTVKVCYKAYRDVDIIETWTLI